MESINVTDPKTGLTHAIPFDQLPHALEAGGQFADESQKSKAIQMQQGGYESNTEQSAPKAEPARPKEATGILGVGSDAISLAENLLSGGINFANDTPDMLQDLGKALQERPGTAALEGLGQFGAEAAELGKSILNTPHDLLKYFIKKHLALDVPVPGTNWHISDLIPHIPKDTGLEKALHLEPKKEFRAVRAVPDIALLGSALKSIGTKAIGGLTKTGKDVVETRRIEDAIADAQKLSKEEIAEAGRKSGLSGDRLEAFKNSLSTKYSAGYDEKLGAGLGEVSPKGQTVAANQKARDIQKRKPLTEIPEREVGEIPPKPDTKAMLEEHQDLIDKAKAEAEAEVGIKTNPSKQVGRKVKAEIEDLEKSTGEIYDAARDYYKDKNIKTDNTAEIKEATAELKDLSANEELFEEGTSQRADLLDKIKALESEEVKASDIYSVMRTSQQLANRARMRRKGTTEAEWNRLTKIADRLDRRANKLATKLEEVGGQDVRSMIKQANKGYRTFKELTVGKFEKGVFKTNPVSKEAFKTGNVSSQALLKLADELPGNQFLNKLVESDPELRKNLLAAYSGESNINKLTNPSSLTKKYIESLPEVEDKLNAFQNALKEYKGKEKEATKIDKAHSELVKSMKEAAKEQKIRKDAIKESDELTRQVKFHKDAIPKLEKRIQIAEQRKQNVQNLKETHGENIDKLKEELKQHKRSIEDKNHRLKALAKLLVHAKGIQGWADKLGL